MRARIVAAALLVLTLGLKLRADVLVPSDDVAGALSRLGANFARAGYATAVEIAPRTRVTVRRGGCTAVLKLLDPHATSRASAAMQLAGDGHVAYAHRGQWRTSPPRTAPLLEYFVKRELVRQGVAAARNPVWIAAIGPGCAAPPDAGLTDVPVRLVPAARDRVRTLSLRQVAPPRLV